MNRHPLDPHGNNSGGGVLLSIQTMRAVAAYAVLLFHLGVMNVGFAGVDIFFVISGFIMGTVGSRETPKTFLKRRIGRIVPLYWLTTLAICTLSLIPGLMRHFTFTIPELIKSLLFIPFTSVLGRVEPLLIPGWTLNYEMFFYLVFAVCLLTQRPKAIAIIALLALPLAGLVIVPDPATSPMVSTYTSPLLLEFSAGLTLSVTNPFKGAAAALLAFIAGLAGFVLMWAYGDLGVISFDRALLLGGPAYLIVAGALAIEAAGHWPRIPLAKHLGDASYSLYLTHGFTLPFIEHIGGFTGLRVAVGLVVPTIVAILTFRLFEKPVAQLLR
ncbi:MAG: acyltransferase [Novosphingobium sp.]